MDTASSVSDSIELFYTNEAQEYDLVAPIVNSRYKVAHEVQNNLILQHLDWSGSIETLVLDIGCGTANDGVDLLEQNLLCKYIGIDCSENMLRHARAKLEARHYSSRVHLHTADALNGAEDRFERLIFNSAGSCKVDAVISAFTFHHYPRESKLSAYRAINRCLKEDGCFVLTDLMNPDANSDCIHFLEKEIDDLKQGISNSELLDDNQKGRLTSSWVEHYRNHKNISAVSDELLLLTKAGFTECKILFQHWQNCVIIARRCSARALRRNFDSLLFQLHRKLNAIEISTVATGKDRQYETLLTSDRLFQEEFYQYFSLSGATFVVADNLEGRFIMLQEGVKDAESYSVRLEMPLRYLPGASSLLKNSWKGVDQYNRFINRVFQIQRGHEGLRDYGDKLSLTIEPDFLARLSSGYSNGDSDVDGSAQTNEDWHHCSADAMFREVVQWRWLLWLINHFGTECELGDALRRIKNSSKLSQGKCDMYFGDMFFSEFPVLRSEEFPEAAIQVMDSEIPQAGGLEGEQWHLLRRKCDGEMRSRQTFEEDVNVWRPAFGKVALTGSIEDLIEEASGSLTGRFGARNSLSQVLRCFHAKAQSPVCPYFYFVSADGRPKEHFVVSILRSDVYPLIYYVRAQDQTHRKQHTAVVIGLASLNVDNFHPMDAESRRRQLLHLKTVLRVCANRIIDKVFVQSLVQSERASSAIKRERILTLSRLPSVPRVFVVGSFDRLITFHSQQSRALMLARAMNEANILGPAGSSGGRCRVGIVGGGLAGLTMAVALKLLGCHVNILEKGNVLMHLQSGARHRYIHPHLANWPRKQSLVPDAQLPVLNWSANDAGKVIGMISSAFKQFQQRYQEGNRIRVNLGVEVGEIVASDDRVTVVRDGGPGEVYDIIVVAIGFGLEKDFPTHVDRVPSYWEDDQIGTRFIRPTKVIVAGSGDGALIDLARASIGTSGTSDAFDHGTIVSTLTRNSSFRTLGEEFEKVDAKIRSQRILSDSSETEIGLYDEYKGAFLQLKANVQEDLLNMVKSLIRTDTKVDIVHRRPGIFRLDSILFNRCLVFLLLEAGIVNPIQGSIKSVESVKGGSRKVTLEDSSGRMYELMCDRLVVRYGPDSDHVKKSIRGLESAADHLRRFSDMEIASELDKATYDFFAGLIS